MGGQPPRVLRIQTLASTPTICRVDIEGRGQFRLDVDTVHALGLAEGQEIGEAVLARVAEASTRYHARAIALRLLQRRLRSRTELEAALRRRSVPRQVVLAVLADLCASGWIDDARFAHAWIRDRMALRPCGARRLRAELLTKGVAPQIADDAIAALVPRDAEEAQALAQARTRLARLRGLAPRVVRRRIAAWLQRRGYPAEVIARTLRAVFHEFSDRADDASAI
jgi:regulatory protein